MQYIHYAGQLGDSRDIIPGQFEGGHTIWQGSVDLLRFIEESNLHVDASTVVLELGCGHGLPGCLLLRKGAKVYFQDLNEDTLTKATIPTIVVNCGVEAISRCTLLCGDWAHVPVLMKDVKVDIILASDTIYTPETIRSFVTAVNELANPETLVWIASQTYYFGLGGGTQALISIIKEMQLPLEVECLKTVGMESVKRDILRIKKSLCHVWNKQTILNDSSFGTSSGSPFPRIRSSVGTCWLHAWTCRPCS